MAGQDLLRQLGGLAETLDVIEKATGAVLGTVGSATADDLDAAVGAARDAQREWSAQPYTERAAVLLRAAALLEADPDGLLPWLVREVGSAQGRAGFELMLVVSELRERGRGVCSVRSDQALSISRVSVVRPIVAIGSFVSR